VVVFTVPNDSHVIGLTVGDIDWPEDSTLVAILRDQAPITPSRDDVLDGGDELFFVTTIAAEDGLRALLSPEQQLEHQPASEPAHTASGQQQEQQAPEDDGFEG
jgi:trk system potassium uptake protein TrkA